MVYAQEFSNIEIENAEIFSVDRLLDRNAEFLLGDPRLFVRESVEKSWISSVDETETMSELVGPIEV